MQILALEERWSDVESGKVAASGSSKGDWSPATMANQYYSRMTQYYTEGNQVSSCKIQGGQLSIDRGISQISSCTS